MRTIAGLESFQEDLKEARHRQDQYTRRQFGDRQPQHRTDSRTESCRQSQFFLSHSNSMVLSAGSK